MIQRIMAQRKRADQYHAQKNPAVLHAIAALIGYGAWAFYANHEYGAAIATSAGIAQGMYAFCATLCSAHIGATILRKNGYSKRGIMMGVGASFSLMLCISTTIHIINGTPDIAQTILPGMIWGTCYMLLFLMSLSKKQTKNGSNDV